VAGSCENCNEPSGSIKGEEFVDSSSQEIPLYYLSFSRKDSTAWN
jgi:hypothetical protein